MTIKMTAIIGVKNIEDRFDPLGANGVYIRLFCPSNKNIRKKNPR